MPLTLAQLATLKAAIIADPTANAIRVLGDSFSLGLWCNGASATVVWRTSTSGDAIRNAIVWANLTPAMAPDATTLWTNRALSAQTKQISLQSMVQGQSQIGTGVAGIRAGFQDCLTALPTKADGTNQGAGWLAVQAVMQRPATRAEALFSTGTGTAASPGDLVFEGTISQTELNQLVS